MEFDFNCSSAFTDCNPLDCSQITVWHFKLVVVLRAFAVSCIPFDCSQITVCRFKMVVVFRAFAGSGSCKGLNWYKDCFS